MTDWEGQCKEKEAEIADLKNQIEKAKGGREVKTFSKDLKILDQFIMEAADIEKQKADKLRDLEGKEELSEEEINQKMMQDMPTYELDSETLQQLVLEVATFKNQKNREIEDLKNEAANAAGAPHETAGDGEKKVSFTPKKTEEGEDAEMNESTDFKVNPMEDSDYYLSDSSKIIRDEDLGNTDVVLSTLVKEIQDMKAKVTLIERSVLSTGAVRTTSSSFYMSPNYGTKRYPEGSSYRDESSKSSEVMYMPQKEDYRDAFLQKSLQLENLQKELAAIKGDTLRFVSKRNNYQVNYYTPFSRRAYKPSTPAWLIKGRAQTGMNSIPRSSTLNQKSILKEGSTGSSRPAAISGGSAYLNWSEVSNFEERRDSLSSTNGSGSSVGKDEQLQNDTEFIRDVQRRYEKRYGKKNLGGAEEEEEYEGRVRNSDDFDWMKGVTNPPMGLSQEMLDRGNKYLRKVAKKYDKEHPNDKSNPRYGFEEDHDLDMIERALKENFVETEHGLEYRIPSHDYY